MTATERDFDRIARAWLDLGPNEAPERTVDAVLRAVDVTPQVRRPVRWPLWRPFTVNRLPVLAALAALIIVVIGVLSLTSGRTPQVAPSPSPAPAIVAPATPDYVTPRPLPGALEGGWVRPAGVDASLVSSEVATIAFGELDGNTSASDYRIDRPNEMPVQGSNVHEVAPGVIEIDSNEPTGSCVNGEAGRYTWSVTGDGQWMTLTPDGTDTCVARGRLLPGTWQRSIAHDNIGGPGIAVNFQPYVQYTLPRMSWSGWGGAGSTVALDSGDGTRSLRIWRDAVGFADPCDITKGHANTEPGMDAFVRYLSTDPRFRVTATEDLTVDGHPAVAVTFRIGDGIKAPCRELDHNDTAKGGVLLWVERSAPPDAAWNGGIASADTLVVTEVDGKSIVFEAAVTKAATGDGDFVADRKFLDSVRFLNELPAPPTP